ncbi:MAG: hypothetical protein ACI4EH_00735 [Oliverpabstia sp.]
MKQEYKQLLRYEYKRLFPVSTWICIIMFTAAFFLLSWKTYEETEEDRCYREVVQEYRGIATSEKIEEIIERAEHYQTVLDTHYQTAEDYAKGKVSDEEFQDFMDDYYYAKEYISGWSKLKEHALRYQGQEQKTYFLYDTAWEKLFENKVDILFVFLMILCFIPYFYKDVDVRWKSIGESYKGYQELKKRRLFFAIFLVLVMQAVWCMGELGILLITDAIPDSHASMCSLLAGTGMREGVSLLGFYIIRTVLLLIKRIVDLLVLEFLSDHGDNKMLAAAVLLVCLLITDGGYLIPVKKMLI